MSRKAGAFADGLVLSVREHGLIGVPKVAIKDALPVAVGDGLPKLLTGCLTSPAHDASNHLPRLFT